MQHAEIGQRESHERRVRSIPLGGVFRRSKTWTRENDIHSREGTRDNRRIGLARTEIQPNPRVRDRVRDRDIIIHP